MTDPAPSAGEIAARLNGQIERLARDLLPAARRAGRSLRVGGVDGTAGASLVINLAGARAGRWCDYASGEHGDALDLIRAVRRCDSREAFDWARGWLGLSECAVSRATPVRQAAPAAKPTSEPDDESRRRAALKIWLAARPSLLGTPGEFYLSARGLDLCELGRQPRALRFHPRLWCAESASFRPGIVAAVSRGGEFCGAHRTYLAQSTDGVWQKAPLRSPKMSLGPIAGGVIPLQRGAAGRPLREAAAGESVALGEGIETCLSIALACPEMRVLCAISLGNLAAIDLPPAIRTVILIADNDAGSGPQNLLRRAARRFVDQGREVRIARSPVGKDFNDLISEGLET